MKGDRGATALRAAEVEALMLAKLRRYERWREAVEEERRERFVTKRSLALEARGLRPTVAWKLSCEEWDRRVSERIQRRAA